MSQYIVIPEDFALHMKGTPSPVADDYFNYAVTTDGRYVTAAEAALHWPDDFKGLDTTVIELQGTDFPAQKMG